MLRRWLGEADGPQLPVGPGGGRTAARGPARPKVFRRAGPPHRTKPADFGATAAVRRRCSVARQSRVHSARREAHHAMHDRHTRRFGLGTATALVMGNIIGGGIFLLPASVAPFGTVSLVAFGVLTIGAVALALVFGRLAERHPDTGGPYVYAREAFGDFAGFLSAWSYWTMTWVSNAALAVAAVGYVHVLLPGHDSGGIDLAVALGALWLPALANFAGTRYVGAVQTGLHRPEVRPAALHRRRRPVLLRPGQPRLLPRGRRQRGRRDVRGRRDPALLLRRCGVRRDERGRGPRPGAERRPGHRPRHHRRRRRLPPGHPRRLRHRRPRQAGRRPRRRSRTR